MGRKIGGEQGSLSQGNFRLNFFEAGIGAYAEFFAIVTEEKAGNKGLTRFFAINLS